MATERSVGHNVGLHRWAAASDGVDILMQVGALSVVQRLAAAAGAAVSLAAAAGAAVSAA